MAPRQPDEKLVVIMVGLPARGKTYISQKVTRYLNWLGITTRVFNVGDYRRKICGAEQPHDFFDVHNREAEVQRQRAAGAALEDLLAWLQETDGQVAIYDATNTTKTRRKMLHDACKEADIGVLYVESICGEESVVLANIREVKLSSPDYAHMDTEEAIRDFQQRIKHYAEVYETLDEEGDEEAYSFVKLIDIGARTIINRIQSYRQSRIVFFLINLHIQPRSIYIMRHGETTFNETGRIGGDANLSAAGESFAKALPGVLGDIHEGGRPLTVWTSTLRRTMDTARHLPYPKLQWKALDELDGGVCDGLTYEEIEKRYPEDFALRDQDKFNFRYRGGESYADLVLRLEPIIMELERQENILIIGHQAVLRAILAYFLNKSHDELPYLKIPLHMVIKLTPKAYGCQVSYYQVAIDAVDTYRPRPGTTTPPTPANSITIQTTIND